MYYDGASGIQMSRCLFGSHTRFLIACNSEQMKLSFGVAFSVCCLFHPPPNTAGCYTTEVILTEQANPVRAAHCAHGISKRVLSHRKSFQLHHQMCGACGTGRELEVSSPACWEVLDGEEVAGGGRVLPAH